MTAFGPRVGKQKIECFRRSGGQQIAHRIGTFHPQQPYIVELGCLLRGTANSTKQALDPQKILLRHALRQRAKKRTVAAAKIDMQRRVAGEEFFEIKPLDQRPWFDDRRTDVPAVSRFNLLRRHAEEKTAQRLYRLRSQKDLRL